MEITLPKRKNIKDWFMLLLVIFVFISSSIGQELGTIILLFIFGFLSFFITIMRLFYSFNGYEKLVFEEGRLKIVHYLIYKTIIKNINICDIESIGYRRDSMNPFKYLTERHSFIIYGIKRIVIKTNSAVVKCGVEVYDYEAKPIIEKLESEIENIKKQKCV